jgi:hypothetical protein
MTLPFPVYDYLDGDIPTETFPTKQNTKPLPESFGRNLDTLEKARLWLINPHNWHSGTLFILKWDGLLCTVMKEHGEKLIKNPEDMGLPWCVVTTQKQRRHKGERGESMEEVLSPSGEEQTDG